MPAIKPHIWKMLISGKIYMRLPAQKLMAGIADRLQVLVVFVTCALIRQVMDGVHYEAAGRTIRAAVDDGMCRIKRLPDSTTE